MSLLRGTKKWPYKSLLDETLIRVFLKILEPLYPWLQEIKKSSQDQLEQTDASGDDGDDKKTDSKCDEKKDVDTETDQESKNKVVFLLFVKSTIKSS
jgi:hypothetical protein